MNVLNKILSWFDKPKVMVPKVIDSEWTKQNSGYLNDFLNKTETGKALINELKKDLIYSQGWACVPSKDVDAKERCAMVHGKQLLLSKLINLSVIEKKPDPFMMTEDELNSVLKNRIAGYQPNDYSL